MHWWRIQSLAFGTSSLARLIRFRRFRSPVRNHEQRRGGCANRFVHERAFAIQHIVFELLTVAAPPRVVTAAEGTLLYRPRHRVRRGARQFRLSQTLLCLMSTTGTVSALCCPASNRGD